MKAQISVQFKSLTSKNFPFKKKNQAKRVTKFIVSNYTWTIQNEGEDKHQK